MAQVLERSLYQTDYYAWTRDQAAKLRAMTARGVNSTLDLEHLAEEVESLGRSASTGCAARCGRSSSICFAASS
jgi:Domain of unknown function DUF29